MAVLASLSTATTSPVPVRIAPARSRSTTPGRLGAKRITPGAIDQAGGTDAHRGQRPVTRAAGVGVELADQLEQAATMASDPLGVSMRRSATSGEPRRGRP